MSYVVLTISTVLAFGLGYYLARRDNHNIECDLRYQLAEARWLIRCGVTPPDNDE